MEGSMHYFSDGRPMIIQVNSPEKDQGYLVLYDHEGTRVSGNFKLHLKKGMNFIPIDTKDLTQGIYVVKITTPAQHFSRKITKY